MNNVVSAYLLYLAITVPLAVWVARTLHRHARKFLVTVFDGDEEMANSVNSLLVIGFILMNLGFIALAMATEAEIVSSREMLELVSTKVGLAVLGIGTVHLINVWAFNTYRRRAIHRQEGFAVVAPSGFTSAGFTPPTYAPAGYVPTFTPTSAPTTHPNTNAK
jgi:hypothetical protein